MEDPVAAPSSSAPVPTAAAAPARVTAVAVPAATAAPPALAPQKPPATATVAAAAAVPESAASCRRQVFSVELRPGETTIVSWKKLQREAGHVTPAPAAPAEPAFAAHAGPSGAAHPAENDLKDPSQPNRFNAVIEKIERLYMGKHSSDEEDLDDVPDDDQYDTEDSFIDDAELDEYFEVENLTTKHDGYFVNKGKLEQIDLGPATTVAPKKRRRKDASSDNNQIAPAYRDKGTSVQLDFQQRKGSGENQDQSNRLHRKEKQAISEYPSMAMASAYSTQTLQPVTGREGSGTKPKGTRLERAIRDLQKFVSEYIPPTIDINNEVDPNGQAAVKRRLPQEVKQKLAKVARLSVNQGKIQEHELMDRLMGIVGHLVQRRTLKRNMKEMVESGLSAKLEKADRFQRVKTEINDMIKARVAAKSKVSEQQDGSADDFQLSNDERRALRGRSVMDTALEDRICDLYDLYVEGMDEDKGPQSRKLYVELAELWPQGYMDNVGIKDAISRSKERKRALYTHQKVRNEEKMKRKRMAAAAKVHDGYPVAMQSAVIPQVAQPSMTNPVTYPAPDYGQNQGLKGFERVRETSSSVVSDDSNRNVGEMKKKRRKSEADFMDAQGNPLKAPSQHVSERQKPSKSSNEASAGSLPAMVATETVLGLPSTHGHNQQPS
ncbi:hypothetical protein QOZ80_1BG0092040 [Eleusine coracana subsp. coracana]|nr:hypothetical protein QOZ80_1BG0092040 [Eleusine coracana subsp. coracana]